MAGQIKTRASSFVVCSWACVAGIFAGTFFAVPKDGYALYYGKKFIFQATVTEEPTVKDRKFSLVVQPAAGMFVVDGRDTNEKILITGFASQNYGYGDQLYVTGKLSQPQPSVDFDYPDYLHAKGIFAQVSYPSQIFIVGNNPQSKLVDWSLRLKHWLFYRVESVLPKTQAGFAEALVAGDKANMDAASVQAFSSTGTAHMVAVSGYKLTLVLVAIESVGAWIGRRTASFAAVLFGAVYLACSGFVPAVVRAVVMSILFVLARASGRRYALLPSLMVAALVILALDPLAVRFDLGFILSFVGILGIIYFSPIVKFTLAPIVDRLPRALGIREIFVSTTAAQLATMPIMAYSFHQLPLIAPVANLLVVPLLAPMILATYLTAIPIFGVPLAWAARLPLAYITWVVTNLARVPFSCVQVNISWQWLCIIYTIELFLLMIFPRLFKMTRY